MINYQELKVINFFLPFLFAVLCPCWGSTLRVIGSVPCCVIHSLAVMHALPGGRCVLSACLLAGQTK
jgi:hypothetical protein